MNRHQRRAAGEPSRADHDRVAQQIETTGCSHCGARFGIGIPYVVGRIKASWTGRCLKPCCTNDFLPGSPLFIGTSIGGGDPWTENDRDWFRAHPARSWRLRWPMPGELETMATDEELAEQAQAYPTSSCAVRTVLRRRDEGGAEVAIAVHQFEPGKRLRVPFQYLSNDPPECFTDAAIPALLPGLVKIAQNHRAAWQLVGTKAAYDAQLHRRLDAMAKIVRDGAS